MAIRFGTQDVLGDGGSFRPGATVNTGHPLHDEFLSWSVPFISQCLGYISIMQKSYPLLIQHKYVYIYIYMEDDQFADDLPLKLEDFHSFSIAMSILNIKYVQEPFK